MWTKTTKMFSETKQNKRIRVLKDEEYQQIYGLPTFSREEQEWFFELTQQELSVLDTAATTETKIDAILQLGYFKAKQSFFAWTFNSVQSDFDYIRHRYFDSVITTKSTIGRKAKYNNQQWVLSLFGYALFSKEKHSERLSEKINNPARTYYASLAEHYTAQGLNRTKQLQSCFWLLCFIHYRYQRMCDNLVTMFIYIFNQYDKAIKESTQALLLAEALSEAAQKAVVAKLMRFYIDKDIDRTQPFSSIIEKAYSIIDPELIEQVATQYENHKFSEKFTWQSIDDLARTYNPLLRSLLRVLPFTSNKHRSLQLALTFIKTTLDDEQSLTKAPYKNFPKQIISASIKEHIIDEVEQMIHVGRYEDYCYSKVTCYLENKSLFITDSTKYRLSLIHI